MKQLISHTQNTIEPPHEISCACQNIFFEPSQARLFHQNTKSMRKNMITGLILRMLQVKLTPVSRFSQPLLSIPRN